MGQPKEQQFSLEAQATLLNNVMLTLFKVSEPQFVNEMNEMGTIMALR